MKDSFLNNCLHPGLPVREWNLLKFFLSPSSPKLPSTKVVGGILTGVYFVPCCYLVTPWKIETHLDWNGLVYFHFKKQTRMFVSVETNLWLCAILCKGTVSQLQSKWILYVFLSLWNYFLDLISSWLTLSLYSLSSSALPSLYCYYLSQPLSFQFSQILVSIAFSEICCHLEQHPSLFESTNQLSCWISFPSLLSWSFWMHSQVCLHCD